MPFYHKKILSDPASTIALLSGGKEIAVAPLVDSLSVSVGVSWTAGGGLIDAFQQGIAKGANNAMNMARNIQNDLANIGNRAGGNFNGAEQGILVTGGGDYYKKYAGSKTDFSLPQLSFIFINEDDTHSVIDRAKKLANYLVPKVTNSSNADYRYELPPNNFQTPNQGFDPSHMTGWFGIRIGSGRKINYFVPNNVSIKYSSEVSLVDNTIPQSIEITVTLEPAYKFMGPDVISVMG